MNAEDIVEKYKKYGNFTKVANDFSMNRGTITSVIKEHLKDWKSYRKTKIDHPWKSADIQVLKSYPNISLLEISEKLGRSYTSVKHKAYCLNLSLSNKKAAQASAKRNGQKTWNKKKVIKQIHKIYNDLDSHYDAFLLYPHLYDATQRYFGSWKNAIKESGLDYEALKAKSGFFLSIDGTSYDSRSEAMIANFLYKILNIDYIKSYESHKLVCKNRRWTCDFYVTLNNNASIWLEFDGLKDFRLQKNLFNEKIKFYKENNFNFKCTNSVNKTIKFILEEINKEEEYNTWIVDNDIFYSKFGEFHEEYRKTLIEDILSVYNTLGHVPTTTEYAKHGTYDISTLRRHIGPKWIDILMSSNLWEKYNKKRLQRTQVIEIKKRIGKKEDIKSIANSMNVSLAAVRHIYYNNRWKNVSI